MNIFYSPDGNKSSDDSAEWRVVEEDHEIQKGVYLLGFEKDASIFPASFPHPLFFIIIVLISF